jgi:hypothetical protein
VRPLWRVNGSVFCICCGPRQRSLSRVVNSWDSWPYFTVSGMRLPFSSPPTTRRVTVEVFLPASTRVWFAESESESELLYDRRFTANQFVLAPSPLRLKARIFSQLNSCGHSPYITSSLTRGWVCHLQLLLALASAVILGSESRGTRDPILLSQIRDSPFRRPPRLTGSRWRYSTPPPHCVVCNLPRTLLRQFFADWVENNLSKSSVFYVRGDSLFRPSLPWIYVQRLHQNPE